jgi:NAD(P)-dependent dehydrogenase (short-subunit alcohol dehydrogenase family)
MPHSPHTFFITGANRGIGLEFARRLTARGDRVLATARKPEEAADLKANSATVFPLDVADDASLAALPGLVKNEPIDILINNAGVGGGAKSIETLEAAELARVFRVNAFGAMLVTKALLPNLRAGIRKSVVNITSQLGSIANNTGGSSYEYRGSKAALNMLTVCLSNELKPQGFTCIAIHPGWVQTDMGGPNATLTPEQSVASLIKVIDALEPGMTGKYLNYDGQGLPW